MRSPKPPREARQVVKEFIHVERAAVRELVLEKLPRQLVGIELWGIGGEAFDLEARMTGEHRLHVRSAVDGAAVPEEEDGAVEMAQQQSQERRDLDMGDVLKVQMAVEPDPPVGGADRHRRDRRDLVALVAVDQHWRLTARCPRAADRGHQQKAALVQECQVGVQAPGFFLICTQV